MARKISAEIRDLAVPDSWMTAIDADPTAGVTLACDLVIAVKDSGAFDGAHLIPVSRYQRGCRHPRSATRRQDVIVNPVWLRRTAQFWRAATECRGSVRPLKLLR